MKWFGRINFHQIWSKTNRLIDILTRLNAKRYLSGPAAKCYIQNDQFLSADIDLEYKVYEYPAYPQRYGVFDPEVSVIDLLFNCGPESRQYLKSLRRPEVVVESNKHGEQG
ncbi:MAG: WbqC family protein [Bdellovibrionales bacterium]|nr:WbqC family protein [Bdellovibrionales bacterium]